jgi:glycosyltransferase involved in cell wall biosynthesis
MKVTGIVNCRYEGLLLEKSLQSAVQSIDASGFADECELVAVADNATRTTLSVLSSFGPRLGRVLETDFSDLGAARNAGAEISRGELILFLDGDDLWCRNWVAAAWAEYQRSPSQTILHPQYSIYFGSRSEVLVHADWRDPSFDPRALVACNHWTALCGIRRELLVELPNDRCRPSIRI